ncbi:hypothetical protein CJD36_010795 [Flavipsychrobacter stenotrophus]|uniref:DUF4842 domain-containing protein n=1 Tax=Flavipsychrobacter stenotrophus TaxID=2077091 RepID=A0A2S7SV22_9BACT|nr:LruC domain-containing protein [Flavipsychrobacter stenotrophus]PQJ10455.1 hypothetical protein CJD36_010795 [Flavipsychrobacter stenotrophus]
MKQKLLLAALFCAIAIPSCRKTDNNPVGGNVYNSVNDITAPTGFNWESSRMVPFVISITDARFSTANHSIAIYNGDPFNGGSLLTKGSANTGSSFTSNLSLAKTINEVYIVKTSPDNSMIVNKVNVGGGVTMSFGETDPTVAAKKTAQRDMSTMDDCSSGCTRTITTNTSNVDVNSGNVVCITGSNITVGFQNVNGGTIRVCGTNVTLQNLNFGGAATLLITAGASATASINFNSSAASIINYGTLTSSFPLNGAFTNHGTYTSTGDFNLNSNAQTFINNGTMTVNGSFNNGSPSSSTNNGTLVVTGNFQQNSGAAAFVNNCSLTVNGNYNQSSVVKNYNLIKVAGTSTINSGTELGMYNGAMLKTVNFINNATVKGYGSTSLVKITGSTTIFNSGAVANGALQICSSTTVGASYLTGGAANGCTLYIPTSGCNSEGNGTPAVTDTDGDGVSDALDAYPTDATKAYNSYYPTAASGGTLAFEDNWPSKGDFDMNDMVMGYRYQVVTNASNVVVKVIANYTLRATGGEYQNGFGVQFPVNRANVTNVTGATLEAGQAKAVMILFTDMRAEMANWNTVPGAATTPEKSYTVSFDVTSGPTLSTFGLTSYNPFIYNFGRGRETHLSAHAPTDLATASYFGTADDNSSVSASRYYVTATGLPFAIDIPTAPFNYPIERKDITQAFLHFGEWGTSGGTSFVDWYSNTGTGYRNTANIYSN